MNKFTILGGAALIVFAGIAAAQPGERPDHDPNASITRQQVIERVDQHFARMDLNRDGRFTREEAQQAHEQHRAERTQHMFDRFDVNRDGSITREEMNQAHAQMRAQRGEGGEGHGRRGMRRMHGMGGMHGGFGGFGRGERLFGEQGFVTLEQMRERALARFDRADANRDGTLTVAERQQARAQFRQRIQERREEAQ